MRIHIQNPTDGDMPPITRAQWDEACGRAGGLGTGHEVTIGGGKAAFDAAIGEAEAVIAIASSVGRTFPAPAPHLKLVFVTAAGLEGLAPFDWLPPGCALLNNRGTHEAKAGEFALMAILMLASRIPQLIDNQRAGVWKKIWGNALAGQRLTVVGLGTLGGAAATHGKQFGMRVTGIRTRNEPHPACDAVTTADDLDRILPETDILVLACPLTEQTRNLMSARRLALLPAHAGIVNIGRGGLVDQDALCDMLDAEKLSGAVLDVFTPEPIPAGHRLWNTRNLVISPHTSADDPLTYNPRSLDIFFANLAAFQAGQPMPNRYDIVRGY